MSARAVGLTLITVAVAAMSAVFSGPLRAQEPPRRALVLGGLPSVGVLLPIGSRWAVRPDLSLSGYLQYIGGVGSAPPRSTARIGVGLSALRLLDPGVDSLRPYLVARLGYVSIRTEVPAGESDADGFEAQGAVGAGVHFQASDRFGLFVELLADYGLQRSELGGIEFPRTSTFTRWQLRPTLGVTLRRAQRTAD